MGIRGRIISASGGHAQSAAQDVDAFGIKIAGARRQAQHPPIPAAPYQGAEVFEAVIFSPKSKRDPKPLILLGAICKRPSRSPRP
jgi:hypothetical protein